jgi:hypothetical protein
LRGVSEPERHIREFEKTKWRDDGCFCDVRMNWNLVVCFHHIYGEEDFPASKLLCKVGNVPNWMLVEDGPSVQSAIIATGFAAVFFLWDEVDWRSTGAIRTPSGAVSEHLEHGFRYSEAFWC